MGVQSSYYAVDGSTKTYPSTKHIASKQHAAVYFKRIADSVWEYQEPDLYRLVNNSIVFISAPDNVLYTQLEIRVADDFEELAETQTDISVVAGAIDNINIVAENITKVIQAANGEYLVNELPKTANDGDLAVNVSDGGIYEWFDDGWNLVGSSGATTIINQGATVVDVLPPTDENGSIVYNTSDGRLYTFINGAWQYVVGAPVATDVIGIEVFAENPTENNYEGRVIFNTTTNQMMKYVSGAWVQVVEPITAAEEVANASITVAKFASGITPVEVVDEFPVADNFIGRVIVLTTDGKLYRYTALGWTSAIPATDITGTITETQIATDAITTPKIAAGAITTAELSAGAVTADTIASNAITTAKIAAGAIGASQIAAGAITTEKLAAGVVTADKIAAGAIAAVTITAGSITSDKLAANSVIAGKIASGAVGTNQLTANCVTSAQIAAGAVTATQIAANSITADKLKVNTITADKIQANTITATNLASNQMVINASYNGSAKAVGTLASNGIYTLLTYTYTVPPTVTSGSKCVVDINASLLNSHNNVGANFKITHALTKSGTYILTNKQKRYLVGASTGGTDFGAGDLYQRATTTVSAGDTIALTLTVEMGNTYASPSCAIENIASMITIYNKTT